MKGKKRAGLVGPCVCGSYSVGIVVWAKLFLFFFLLDLDLNVMKKLDMIFFFSWFFNKFLGFYKDVNIYFSIIMCLI